MPRFQVDDGFVRFVEDCGSNVVNRKEKLAWCENLFQYADAVRPCDLYKGYNTVVNGRYYFNVLPGRGRKVKEE